MILFFFILAFVFSCTSYFLFKNIIFKYLILIFIFLITISMCVLTYDVSQVNKLKLEHRIFTKVEQNDREYRFYQINHTNKVQQKQSKKCLYEGELAMMELEKDKKQKCRKTYVEILYYENSIFDGIFVKAFSINSNWIDFAYCLQDNNI